MKKGKFLVAGILLFIALGFVGYRGFASSATYYLTVSELNQKASSLSGEKLKVSGKVVAESVKSTLDAQGQVLRFTVVDDKDDKVTLAVVYRGVVPDTFKPDSEVVLEGILTSSGIFQADKMLTRCASKYIPGS